MLIIVGWMLKLTFKHTSTTNEQALKCFNYG